MASKACPTCAGTQATPIGNCQTCFWQGHNSRLMTLAELTASLSQPHVTRYPVAVTRRQEAIAVLEAIETTR